MFLTDHELRELTQRQRAPAQRKALRAMGIEHRTRPDGSVVVLRAHVEKEFGLAPAPTARAKMKTIEPNWGALNAKA